MNFVRLSQYFSELENTTSRNSMVGILAKLFRETSEGEVDKICYLLQGRVLPLFEPIEFGLADRMIIKALGRAFNKTEDQVNKIFKAKGDLGIVAEQLRAEAGGKGDKLLVVKVYEKLSEVAFFSGPGSVEKKITMLSELFSNLDSLSCRYIARIPLNKLRLGFSDMTILDGLSWMLSGTKKDRPAIEAAYNVRPDLGFIAETIKTKGLAGLKKTKPVVGTPILMTRAERLTGGEEIVKKIGRCAIEYKYDGFRLQVHFSKKVKSQKAKVKIDGQNLGLFEDDKKEFVRLFSRNLEDVTNMYPDVVQGVIDQIKAEEAIFEGEAIAFSTKTGEFLPFQETVQRRRKYDISQKAEEIPLRLVVFELLYVNGESLLETAYQERRKKLESIFVNHDKTNLAKKTVVLSEIQICDKAKKIDEIFSEAIRKGLEGIMAKKLQGVYQAGARGWNWIKYKKSYSAKLEDTIDAVVMGYDFGQGKRQGFGIGDFLIGVYDSQTDKFLTVAKIGTGLTDEEWRTLKVSSSKYQAASIPKRYVVDKAMKCDAWVEPKMVVEINADEITRSPVHTAGRKMGKSKSGTAETVIVPGFALRFPRLKTFREKQPEDATTVEEIEKMYKRQGH
ncbi:ATP-dependent DNA ligase [Candidatus Microgenomates bacterium]|nr:ATP-dependent DNA ligase [Candidatus Microgenomates bacterium]